MVQCNNESCKATLYLSPSGFSNAVEWMTTHVEECYQIKNPTESQMVGKFKSQASKAERNPARYLDRNTAIGNNEPASDRAIRRK